MFCSESINEIDTGEPQNHVKTKLKPQKNHIKQTSGEPQVTKRSSQDSKNVCVTEYHSVCETKPNQSKSSGK